MRFRLLTYDIIDEYEHQRYIRYKYQIEKQKQKHIYEINVNINHLDVVYNFVYQLAKLYKTDRLRVTFKNMMYVLNNNKISEYKIF